MSCGETPSALSPSITAPSDVPPPTSTSPAPISSPSSATVRGTTTVSPWAKGFGWTTSGSFLDPEDKAALRDRDAGNAHVLAHDDRAGALIDDDPGEGLRFDREVFDPADGMGGGGLARRGDIQEDGAELSIWATRAP